MTFDSKQNHTALVVDDERDIRDLLSMTLSRMGITVKTAADLASAKQALAEQAFDLCFTDMKLPDGSGQTLIELIAKNYPNTPVAMITAHGNMDAAVEALKAGAFDFVSKPVDLKELRLLAKHALGIQKQTAEHSEKMMAGGRAFIGNSPIINQLKQTIKKLARSQAPVCIGGESGVGKELVARLIHEQSPRSEQAFVAVNCGAIPTELMESEFFGHLKGSFTGAVSDKDGLFVSAAGGTLFLDEVAELPLHMQVKLLRVIQEKTVRPIGATAEQPIDVRILSATHKDLVDLVAKGIFRHDLYYRINVIELKVPPLRQRGDDIQLLATHVLKSISDELDMGQYELSDDAMRALIQYRFPGNVRELQNILERAVALSDGHVIQVNGLYLPDGGMQQAVVGLQTDVVQPAAETADATLAPQADKDTDSAIVTSVVDESNSNDADDQTLPMLPEGEGLNDFIEQVEREAIMQALEACKYNKTKAAEKLGLSFRALRYKLKKLNID